MTPEELGDIAFLMFGDKWVNGLAMALKVNRRTVQRWANGALEIPEGVEDDIAAWVADYLYSHAMIVAGDDLPIVGQRAATTEFWSKEFDARFRHHLGVIHRDFKGVME